MIVAISYHDGDLALMRRWANHVVKLGSYHKHKIIIAPVHNATTEGIADVLRTAFSDLHVVECYHTESGWPISCNKAFEAIATYIAMHQKRPFLFMEPDAVPLVASWIDDIEAEYTAKQRPFMGDFVGARSFIPNAVDHMSGVAVYTNELHSMAPSVFRNEYTAWDIASAKDVVPQMARTNLIHHDWVPTKQWRRDKVDASVVREGAVIYHPDKLGVLFNDGLAVPSTRVGGEPQTGAGLVEPDSSFEQGGAASSKEKIENIVDSTINDLAILASHSPKLKKYVIARLYEKNLYTKNTKAKTKRAKPSGNKVRKSVEEFDGPRAY